MTEDRLKQSTDLISTMTGNLKESQDTSTCIKLVAELLKFKFSLENAVEAKEREKSDVEKLLVELRESNAKLVVEKQQELSQLTIKYEQTVSSLETSCKQLKVQLEQTEMDLKMLRAENCQYKVNRFM